MWHCYYVSVSELYILWKKPYRVTIHMKAAEQHFHVVPFIFQSLQKEITDIFFLIFHLGAFESKRVKALNAFSVQVA